MKNMWNTVLALIGPIQGARNIPGNNHENRLDVAVSQRSGKYSRATLRFCSGFEPISSK